MNWEQKVLGSLKDYPNSFQLGEFVQSQRRRYSAAVKNYQVEPFDSQFEEVRNDNFLTCLLLKLGKTNEAIEMNDKVLAKAPRNIVALANRVYIHKFIENDDLALETLGKLQELQAAGDFDRLHDEALGEIAYSYTRMGPKYYHKAISLFKEIIGRRPDDLLLKFGLALVSKRCLTQCIFSISPTKDVSQLVVLVVGALNDVVRNSHESNLKGKSYVLLGEVYKMIQECVYPLSPVLVSTLEIDTTVDVEECYRKAYEAATKNRFVLERAGRYFKEIGKYTMAEKLLKESIQIRPQSTFAHHHLALVYKELAVQDGGNDYEKLLQKALEHIDQSVRISKGTNSDAVYDFGILYTMLEQYQEAEIQFRKLIEKGKPQISPLVKANAFEQLGLFYQKQSEGRVCTEKERVELKTKCKRMLTKSIEEAAKAVVDIPGMETPGLLESWKALPTLEELLLSDSCETQNVEIIKEVARLRALMCKYKSSLDLYKRIQQEGPEGFCDVDVVEGMVTNYVKLEDFDNALLTLYLLQSTQTRHLNKERYEFDRNVFLTCGGHFLQENNLDQAKECFQTCFKNAFPDAPVRGLDFDIFILDDSEDSQTESVLLVEFLEYCGLKVTRNDDSVAPGSLRISRQTCIMEGSKSIIIFLRKRELEGEFEYFCNTAINLATSDSGPSNVVMLTATADTVPSCLKGFTSMKYKKLTKSQSLDDQDLKWLHDLLTALLRRPTKNGFAQNL